MKTNNKTLRRRVLLAASGSTYAFCRQFEGHTSRGVWLDAEACIKIAKRTNRSPGKVYKILCQLNDTVSIGGGDWDREAISEMKKGIV